MTTPEFTAYSREEQLVDSLLVPIFKLNHTDQTINRAEDALATFNNLPNENSQDRKIIGSFVVQTGRQLLQNPQDMEIAVSVWKRESDQARPRKRQRTFYDLFKREAGTIFKENWQKVSSEQLSQLVRVYSCNISIQDFTEERLRSHFRGPNSRKQRVDAYYTFVSSVLDLAGDNQAFDEGVRIGLHDTDIIPKDPYLIEQSIFISLPYPIFASGSQNERNLLSLPKDKEEERIFQKLLIAKYMILKLSTMGSKKLEEVVKREKSFLFTSKKVKAIWEQEQARAKKKIGAKNLMQLSDIMNAFLDSDNTLPGETENESNWVQDIFRDPAEPLNQKFKKVFPQIPVSKPVNSSKE